MASSFLTATDLLKLNNIDAKDAGITDLLEDAPFLQKLVSDFATDGTSHTYLKQTSAPVVGFRTANVGRELSDSEDTVVVATLKILDASFVIDKALADAYKRGGPEAMLEREGMRHIKSAFSGAEKAIINGATFGPSGSFSGLRDVTTNRVNANGTTAGTGSSVYFVRNVADASEVCFILGNEGNFDIGEPTVQDFVDGTGLHLPVYYTAITGYAGLQIGTIHSVARIHNITEDAGKTLSDTLLSKALELFPSSRPPTDIIMNRRSLGQL